MVKECSAMIFVLSHSQIQSFLILPSFYEFYILSISPTWSLNSSDGDVFWEKRSYINIIPLSRENLVSVVCFYLLLKFLCSPKGTRIKLRIQLTFLKKFN